MSRISHIGFPVVLLHTWLVMCSLPGYGQNQEIPATPASSFTIDVRSDPPDTLIQLPHQFIISNTETLRVNGQTPLLKNHGYTIDYRSGTIRLDSSALKNALNGETPATLTITYRYLPLSFRESYFRRRLVEFADTSSAETLRVSRPRTAFGIDDIFGRDLQKSGSIVRGVTVGSNRDLSLNSGFRMQLAGKIASDVEVIAALTDENTPIQPEGTTQTLQEFDKVFVEIRGSDYGATLGDFPLEFQGSEFARLTRKLQGAKGTADYHTDIASGTVLLAGAVTRGKFTSNQFPGVEGVQGPYRLGGRNNERNIIIIAGTERVYVNGERQVRGETNDYTIDYSSGELRFTARRLITSASRITVDFEYTDRQFSRSLLAAHTSTRFAADKASLTFSYFREADDPDAPVDFELNDSTRQILARAGDDRNKAVVSGVSRVDSNGLYIRVDTLLSSGQALTFYRYAPGNPLALYTVGFTYVGFGKGDYVRKGVGEFEWRGPGGGEYLPVRFLPFAQSHNLLDVGLNVDALESLKLSGEFARSVFDANRFSTIDDADNAGHALNFTATFAPKQVHIGSANIGDFDIRVKERFVDGKFVPIDRTNEIEFSRKWGIDSLLTADEETREASVKYSPLPSLSVGGGYGKITRGDAFRSVRNDATFGMKGESLPTADYFLESIRSREYSLDNIGSWLRQRGATQYSLWKLTPTFRFETENRKIRSFSTPAEKPGSFAYNLYAPGIALADLGKVSLSSEFEWRADDRFLDDRVLRESRSFTQSYTARLAEWNSLTSSIDLSLRKKVYKPAFKVAGNTDIKTVLVRNQSRYAPLNRGVDAEMFYQVATERSSRLERVFVRVPQGTGNYRYLGDLNNNGITDENEFELTRFDGDYIVVSLPSDELFPVIDLKTSMRLRIVPRRFVDKGGGVFGAVTRVVSTETYIRVEEKSSEPDLKQIYLLHFSRFQKDSTTIAGSTLFTQDVTLFDGEPAFSSRLRFSQRKGLNRFSTGIERNMTRERSIRLRWQLVSEIANQIDYVNKTDMVSGDLASGRSRDIHSDGVTFDLSYRPEQNIELGIKIDVAKGVDRFQNPQLESDLNAQTVRFVYALTGAGQIRVETAREEIILGGTPAATIPFELTGGRVPGKTWLWRTSFDYRVTEFVQATVNYDGRSEGGRSPVHTARAEVRAFF